MKTFPIQLDDELHKKIKHAAIEKDLPVHAWIINAITNQLQDEKKSPRKEGKNNNEKKKNS